MKLNILIEINHPAHFHLFKNPIDQLINWPNTKVIILAKRDQPLTALLETKKNWHIVYEGYRGKSVFKKIIKQIRYTFLAMNLISKENIDICAGVSVTMPHAAFIKGRKSFVFDDDDKKTTPIFAFLAHSLATKVFSPDCLNKGNPNKKDHYYQGFHELAYLHPQNFTPVKSVLDNLKIKEKQQYFIVRFNAFKAHHDRGEHGLNFEQRKTLLEHLRKYGEVIVSEEGKGFSLNNQFLNIHPIYFHSLLNFASLYIGESQTMASEAAMLGIPAIRINSFKGRISYLDELEVKYDLLRSFTPDEFDEAIKYCNKLLKKKNTAAWQQKRQNMLNDKIDVSKYIVNQFVNKSN